MHIENSSLYYNCTTLLKEHMQETRPGTTSIHKILIWLLVSAFFCSSIIPCLLCQVELRCNIIIVDRLSGLQTFLMIVSTMQLYRGMYTCTYVQKCIIVPRPQSQCQYRRVMVVTVMAVATAAERPALSCLLDCVAVYINKSRGKYGDCRKYQEQSLALRYG